MGAARFHRVHLGVTAVNELTAFFGKDVACERKFRPNPLQGGLHPGNKPGRSFRGLPEKGKPHKLNDDTQGVQGKKRPLGGIGEHAGKARENALPGIFFQGKNQPGRGEKKKIHTGGGFGGAGGKPQG